jgi:hypothetical protein
MSEIIDQTIPIPTPLAVCQECGAELTPEELEDGGLCECCDHRGPFDDELVYLFGGDNANPQ